MPRPFPLAICTAFAFVEGGQDCQPEKTAVTSQEGLRAQALGEHGANEGGG
ncbi:hypothetical protein [Devosia beringensis]|uniref:hypothetical protein n=1 Tax=Devosia beringensis TaxID=2657486 RepID=UPI00186B76B9|nr:hypothetical protein [Devosia beringensis]